MSKMFAVAGSGCLALSLAAVTLAAPDQADRPGVVVQPRVRVENRGRSEAIPVSIQEWGLGERPVAVQVIGAPTVEARLVSQPWAYRTVIVAAGQDMASALTSAGVEGWEATAIQVSGQAGTSVLLKRPASQR